MSNKISRGKRMAAKNKSSHLTSKKTEEVKRLTKKNIIGRVVGILLIFAGIGLLILQSRDGNKSDEQPVSNTSTESAANIQGATAEISVKDYGKITIQLDAEAAPISVENFTKLAKDGFYDGLTFHRIIDGFMIQGGDPLGNGTGGSENTIKGEFKENGVDNPISHVRGVVSMARSNDPDSASSQFFIVQSDSTYLDGQYAGFGYVTEGMEIVDKICKDVPVQDANGAVKAEDQPVIETIQIIE